MKLSKISDKKVPMTVMAPRTRTIVADINKSSTNNALNSKGPSVGRFNTTDTMMLPDIKKGRRYPSVLTNGFKAKRTGYFNITFHSGNPLALAVIT